MAGEPGHAALLRRGRDACAAGMAGSRRTSARGERERALFSIASLHEPGSFDIKHLGDQKVTGVLVFMVLPGPQDGGSTFSDMIDTSRRIAATLGGELRDDQGSTFNSQRERSIREEIIEYQYLATIERGNAGA